MHEDERNGNRAETSGLKEMMVREVMKMTLIRQGLDVCHFNSLLHNPVL